MQLHSGFQTRYTDSRKWYPGISEPCNCIAGFKPAILIRGKGMREYLSHTTVKRVSNPLYGFTEKEV